MRVKVESNRYVALATLVGMALMSFAMSGCERPDWDDPEYIAQALEEGDVRKRHQAVQLLREVDEEARDIVAGPAATAYMEEERLRSDLMHHLLEWRAPEAKEAYLEELAEDHSGRSARVAEMLGRIEMREAIPQMIEIFEATGNNDRRVGILRGLAAMPDAQALDAAEEVLGLDVDNYPIDLHRAACRIVGGVATEEPDAISDEVRQKVLYARFLGDEHGRHASEQCGIAIQQIGPSMVPHLLTLFRGENEEVQRLLMTYDDPAAEEFFPPNVSRQRAVEHLSYLRAPEAVELYVEHLERTVEVPDDLGTDAQKRAWMNTERRVHNEMIRGLGFIGDPQARPTLERIMSRELVEENWSTMAAMPEAFQYQQNSARALANLGDRQARSALLDVEVHEDWVSHLSGQGFPAQEIYRPVWLGALSFVYLATADDRDRFERFVADMEAEELREFVGSFGAAFEVVEECEGVEDEAERASCLGGFVDAEEEPVHMKAIHELMRLSPEAAGPVLAEAIDTEDLNFRQQVIVAGYRVPAPEVKEAVEEILSVEVRADDDPMIKADRRQLNMFYAWLQHHVDS